jgi:hypothetical protein
MRGSFEQPSSKSAPSHFRLGAGLELPSREAHSWRDSSTRWAGNPGLPKTKPFKFVEKKRQKPGHPALAWLLGISQPAAAFAQALARPCQARARRMRIAFFGDV